MNRPLLALQEHGELSARAPRAPCPAPDRHNQDCRSWFMRAHRPGNGHWSDEAGAQSKTNKRSKKGVCPCQKCGLKVRVNLGVPQGTTTILSAIVVHVNSSRLHVKRKSRRTEVAAGCLGQGERVLPRRKSEVGAPRPMEVAWVTFSSSGALYAPCSWRFMGAECGAARTEEANRPHSCALGHRTPGSHGPAEVGAPAGRLRIWGPNPRPPRHVTLVWTGPRPAHLGE